jgi:hypothetical protein
MSTSRRRRDVRVRRLYWYLGLGGAIRIEFEKVVNTYFHERNKRKQEEIERVLWSSNENQLGEEERQRRLRKLDERFRREEDRVRDLIKTPRWHNASESQKKELLARVVSEIGKGT